MNNLFRAHLAERILKASSRSPLSRLVKPGILSLKTLGLHITTSCNYNCVYCYAEGYKEKKLSLEKIFSLIDEAKRLGAESINLLGGEPLLSDELYKILQYINRKNMRAIIFTNGSLITDKWLESFQEVREIILVIKYDCEAIYSKHTRTNYPLALIEDKISKLVKNNIRTVTFTVVTKHNLDFIDEILSRSVRLGAFPKLHQYMPISSKSTQLNKELEISPSEWRHVLKKISYLYAPLEKLIYAMGEFKFGLCSCFAHNLYVTAHGDVLPCPEAPPELNLGNVLDLPLRKIWEEFKERRKIWLNIPSECERCLNKYSCMGGCKVYAYFNFKEFNKKDPLCCSDIPTTYSHCVYALTRILPKRPAYEFLKIKC